MGTVTTDFATVQQNNQWSARKLFADSNGNLYYFEVRPSNSNLSCYKSTDNGSNWSEFDSANRPAPTNGHGFYGIGTAQVGSTIHICMPSDVYGKDNSFDLNYYTFETSDTTGTEGWNISETAGTATKSSGIGPYPGYIGVRSDGDVLIFAEGPAPESIMGTNYNRIGYWERTGANTWSSGTELYGTGAENDFPPYGAYMDGNDYFHFLYSNNNSYTFTGTVDSANSTNTIYLGNTNYVSFSGHGAFYNNGTSTRLMAAAVNDEVVIRVWTVSSNQLPNNPTEWTVGSVNDAPINTYPPLLAHDPNDDTVTATYHHWNGTYYDIECYWAVDPVSASWTKAVITTTSATSSRLYSTCVYTDPNGNGYIVAVYQNGTNLESAVYQHKIAPKTVNHSADLYLSPYIQHSSDLVLVKTFEQHDADVSLAGTASEAHAADIFQVKQYSYTHSSDVYPGRWEAHSSDLFLLKIFQQHDADLLPVDRLASTHTSDIQPVDVMGAVHDTDILVEQNVILELEPMTDPQTDTGHTLYFRFKVWEI